MKRRTLLKTMAIGTAALAAPRIARSQSARTLKFVPYVDLAILDPMINTASQTRTHGYLVFDTLYGTDANYRPQPQMVEGHTIEDGGKLWTLTLREKLRFHDGEPVRGRDVVASIRRWGSQDQAGRTLLALADEITAPSDRTVRFRFRQPFAMLPEALGKIAPRMPCIMPERLAATPPTKPVPELIGSGPFKFVASERVPGSRVVYERFADYVPRPDGVPGLTSGPKIVHLDRVEWITMPDPATASAALQQGEVDWWEVPTPDLIPLLKQGKIHVEVKDKTGVTPILRFNCIQPPFDNAAIRRAVLHAVNQTEFMSAFSSDHSMWRDKVGVFCPDTPMANDAGMDKLFGPTDFEAAKRAIAAAGYHGARTVMMMPADHPVNSITSQVGADLFKRIGLNVDVQTMDAGTMFQRRANRDSVDHSGWSCFPSMVGGADVLDPLVSFLTRGNGKDAWYGWPTSPRMEELRATWLQTSDLAEQKHLCEQIQLQVWQDAPYTPLGQIVQPTAYRQNVTGVLDGFAKFYAVQKS